MLKLTFERKILLAFLLVIIFLVIIELFAYLSTKSLNKAIEAEKHTQKVLLSLDELLVLAVNAETNARGYIITGNDVYLESLRQAQGELPTKVRDLGELIEDNNDQIVRLNTLNTQLNEKLLFIQQGVEVRRAQGLQAVLAMTSINNNRGKQKMDEIRSSVEEMKREENSLLEIREANINAGIEQTYLMILVTGLVGIAMVGFANFAVFRETGKRRKAEDDLKETNRDLEKRVEERTDQLTQTNRELVESEAFGRTILDSLSAHIAVVDKDGKIVSVNDRWEKFAEDNCGEDAISKTGIGQNYLEICRKSNPFDENTQSVLENLEAILNGEEKTFSLEYACHSPVEERWFILQVNSLEGEKGGAVISHFNITDRKKAEAELKNSEEFTRSIFENSPDCVKVLDVDGTLHSMNTNGLCLMEIDDITPLVGAVWADFWEGEYHDLAAQAIKDAQRGKTAHFEGFCYTAKKTPKWWDVSISPIFGADGKPIRLISTSRDVTDRKEADRERERILKSERIARKDAEIANRLRDEFLATVSHELRAPLNSILGWSKLMQQGKLDEKTSVKAVDTIVRNANSQNRLIEDLLDVSRIISGKLRLEVLKVKIGKLVEAALESVRPAAEAKNITLEVKEDVTVSHVSADPNRIQQVIWNLLSNAIKFTPNDGKVSVEIKRIGSEVEISVKDTGVGIREEFLPHVFERFRQADNSSIRKFGGLGLGLAIVRHITEMHGGTVYALSEGENKGSTFVVKLPLLIAEINYEEPELELEPLLAKPAEIAANVSLDGLLILVVDDEADTRQLLVQALTHYGATIITAGSAQEALTEIAEKRPDVLISDIGMPEEDGYSLIRKVRALPNGSANIQAVALTAFTRSQDRMRSMAAGFQNHVSKPVEIEELVTVIGSLTGRLTINNENSEKSRESGVESQES